MVIYHVSPCVVKNKVRISPLLQQQDCLNMQARCYIL